MDSLTKNPLLLWLVISVAVGALAWTFLRKELRTKAILYSSFLIACFVSMWPIQEKIKLGLDVEEHSVHWFSPRRFWRTRASRASSSFEYSTRQGCSSGA